MTLQKMPGWHAALFLASLQINAVRGAPAPHISSDISVALPPISAACLTTDSTPTCGLYVNQNQTTVVATTRGDSTWSATYVATTLPAYSDLKTATTLTTTDTAGETVIAIILAGGAAWLAVPKPGAPPPEITSPPTMTMTISTPTPSSSSTTSLLPQPDLKLMPPPDWQKIFAVPIVFYADNMLTCGWPGADDVLKIDKKTAYGKIDDFCEDKNNVAVNNTVPVSDEINIGGGYVLNITVSQVSLCIGKSPLESTIKTNDCKFLLRRVLDECDTNSDAKKGGKVDDGCLTWQLRPEYNNGKLECSDPVPGGTGLNREQARKNIDDFCDLMKGSISTPTLPNREPYKPGFGNSEMKLSVSYSQDEQCKPDGEEAEYLIDQAACKRFLYRTLDDCNTDFKGDLGKFGGNITDGCGIYSFTTLVNENIICGGNPYARATDLNPEAMTSAINAYCDRSLTLDPNYRRDSTKFSQDVPEGESYDNFVAGDIWVRSKTIFDPQGQTDCLEAKAFNTKGDECKRRLTAIQGKCGNKGGGLTTNTLDGCVLWSLFGMGNSQ